MISQATIRQIASELSITEQEAETQARLYEWRGERSGPLGHAVAELVERYVGNVQGFATTPARG